MSGISLDYICKRLDNYHTTLYIKQSQEFFINSIHVLDKNLSSLNPDLLYVGKTSDLPSLAFHCGISNIVCISDISLPDEYLHNPEINLLMVNDNVDPSILFVELQCILTRKQKIIYQSASLLDIIMKGGSIQEIISFGYSVFNNPVFLTDISFKLIAVKGEAEIKDKLLKNIIQNGYLTQEVITAINYDHVHQKVSKSNTPLKISKCVLYEYDRIVSAITIDGKISGYLVVIMEDDKIIDEYDKEMMSIFIDLIAKEMQKDDFTINAKGLSYEYFISDILNGKIMDSEILKQRLNYLNFHISKYIYILEIDVNHNADAVGLAQIREQIKNIINNCNPIIFEEKLIVIITSSLPDSCIRANLVHLEDYCRKNKLYAALSNSFSNISELQSFYKQTVKTIEIVIKMKLSPKLFYYTEFALFHISEVFLQSEDIQAFCHPAIKFLHIHDNKNNTEYVHTIFMYLLHNQNVLITSEAMHVHRNTLNYRLKRIEELTKLNLNNHNTRQYIISSCSMLDFIQKIDPKEYPTSIE